MLQRVRDNLNRLSEAARRAADESRQITEITREIRAADPYYADKSDLRVQLDAMKRWRMIVVLARENDVSDDLHHLAQYGHRPAGGALQGHERGG